MTFPFPPPPPKKIKMYKQKRLTHSRLIKKENTWTLTKWAKLCAISFFFFFEIRRFQTALKKYGVPEEEIFQTADLYERRNIPQVTLCLYALSRLVCCTLRTHQKWFFTTWVGMAWIPAKLLIALPLFCRFKHTQMMTMMSCIDAETSRIHGSTPGSQNGRKERTRVYRGTVTRPRGTHWTSSRI